MRIDRQLLLSLLALQNAFISKEQLLAAFSVWASDKSQSIEAILISNAAITSAQAKLLSALVEEHLKQHDDDPGKSFAAMVSMPVSQSEIDRLVDSDFCNLVMNIPSGSSAAFIQPSSDGNVPTIDHLTRKSAGRFRVLRPHAAGGLGRVSIAIDEELRREVALKEIKPEHADRLDSRERFVREAEITSALEHPSIVPIYGLGTFADGRPYYAMRFIKGDSLMDWIKELQANKPRLTSGEKRIALQQLLSRFVDICQAMSFAHSRGVLHRDLKPHNIMLGKYGETLVVDWGLAKTQGTPLSSVTQLDSSRLPIQLSESPLVTMQGTAVGTLAYMSPEQAEGRIAELGPASDIYSLGVTLYHCLTGKVPFEQAEVADALRAIRGGEFTRPRKFDSTIPRVLESICLKAMKKSPSERYSSALKLANDIEHFLADEPVIAHRDSLGERITRLTRKHKSATRVATLGLAVLLVVMAVGAWIINGQREAALGLADRMRMQSAMTSLDLGLTDSTPETPARARDLARAIQLSAAQPEKQGDIREIVLSRIQASTRSHLPLSLKFDRQCKGFALSSSYRFIASVDNKLTLRVTDILTGLNAGKPIELAPAELAESISRDSLGFYNPKVAINEDGSRVVTALSLPDDHNEIIIRIWDVATGKESVPPIRSKLRVGDLHFGSGGERIVAELLDLSGIGDPTKSDSSPISRQSIRIWNAKDGQAVGDEISGSISVFSYASTIPMYFSVETPNRVWQIYGLQDGKKVGSDFLDSRQVVVDPSGIAALKIQPSRRAELWSAETQRFASTVVEGAQNAMFSPDGQWLAIDSNQAVRVYGKDLQVLAGTTSMPVNGVLARGWDISPDSQLLATCQQDSVLVWKVWQGEVKYKIDFVLPSIARFSNDGRLLFIRSVQPNGRDYFRIVQLANDSALVHTTNMDPNESCSHIAVSHDGKSLLTVSEFRAERQGEESRTTTHHIKCWDLENLGRHKTICELKSRPSLVSFGKGASTIEVVPDDAATFIQFDCHTGERISTVQLELEPEAMYQTGWATHDSQFVPISFSVPVSNPDQRTGRLNIFDKQRGGKTIVDFDLESSNALQECRLSSDARHLITVQSSHPFYGEVEFSGQVSVGFFNLKTEKYDLSMGFGDGAFLAMSQDCKKLLTYDATIGCQLWEVETGQPMGAPIPLTITRDTGCYFSPNGDLIICVEHDLVEVWSASIGRKIFERTFPGFVFASPKQHGADKVAFSQDGNYLYIAAKGCLNRVDLRSAPIPKDLDAHIEFTLGFRVGDEGELAPLSEAEYLRRHELLSSDLTWSRERNAHQNLVDRAALLEWLRVAEEDDNWFAEAIQMHHLANAFPENMEFKSRAPLATEKLKHWDLGFRARNAEQSRDWARASELLSQLAATFPDDLKIKKRLERANRLSNKS